MADKLLEQTTREKKKVTYKSLDLIETAINRLDSVTSYIFQENSYNIFALQYYIKM